MHRQLLDHVANVPLNWVGGDPNSRSHVVGAQAGGKQLQHLDLSWGEFESHRFTLALGARNVSLTRDRSNEQIRRDEQITVGGSSNGVHDLLRGRLLGQV